MREIKFRGKVCRGFAEGDDEQVRGTVKEAETKSKPETDSVVVFRPHRPELAEVRVFDSVSDMLKKLSEEYETKVAIEDETTPVLEEGDWAHSQFVSAIRREADGFHIGSTIGICDCKSFKRG